MKKIRYQINQNKRKKNNRLVVRDLSNPEWKNIIPAHEKLWIWQKSNRLYLEICNICKLLPRPEGYNLRMQIERSAKSVKDNIAEGNESYYYNDKIKGFYTSRKESGETQNHLREMMDKKYITLQKGQDMIDEYEEIKRGINGMIRAISAKRNIRRNIKT